MLQRGMFILFDEENMVKDYSAPHKIGLAAAPDGGGTPCVFCNTPRLSRPRGANHGRIYDFSTSNGENRRRN